jgi:hypothetical protein
MWINIPVGFMPTTRMACISMAIPSTQAVASAGEWTHHWYINLGIALPLAAGVAFLSWNWIEKPVLSRKAVLLFIEGRFLSLPFLANFRLQRTTH